MRECAFNGKMVMNKDRWRARIGVADTSCVGYRDNEEEDVS